MNAPNRKPSKINPMLKLILAQRHIPVETFVKLLKNSPDYGTTTSRPVCPGWKHPDCLCKQGYVRDVDNFCIPPKKCIFMPKLKNFNSLANLYQ